MKRTLWITLAAAVAAGCVEEKEHAYDPVVPLVFQPVVCDPVRSEMLPGGAAVCVWQYPAGANPLENPESAAPLLSHAPIVEQGAVWSSEPPCQWPASNVRLAAIGYAPVGAAAECNASRGVVFANVDAADPNAALLRYADLAVNLDKRHNGGVVPLLLRTPFCEVDIRFRLKGNRNDRITLLDAEFDRLAMTGEFASRSHPQWIIAGEHRSLRFFEGEMPLAYTAHTAGQSFRLIPQLIESPISVRIEYAAPSGERIVQTLRSEPLRSRIESGRRYTFTLAVDLDGIEIDKITDI